MTSSDTRNWDGEVRVGHGSRLNFLGSSIITRTKKNTIHSTPRVQNRQLNDSSPFLQHSTHRHGFQRWFARSIGISKATPNWTIRSNVHIVLHPQPQLRKGGLISVRESCRWITNLIEWFYPNNFESGSQHSHEDRNHVEQIIETEDGCRKVHHRNWFLSRIKDLKPTSSNLNLFIAAAQLW